jgi:transposase-like protein
MEPVRTEEDDMARRTWTGEEKVAVVLEMLKGQETVTSVCQRHGVALSQAYRWRDAFLERGQAGLRDQRNPKHRDPVQEELRQLRELAGSQALIIDAQKKLASLPAFGRNGSW